VNDSSLRIYPGTQLVSYPKLQLHGLFSSAAGVPYLHDSSLHISPGLQPKLAFFFQAAEDYFSMPSTAFSELPHIL
jgi:hypothetical protein